MEYKESSFCRIMSIECLQGFDAKPIIIILPQSKAPTGFKGEEI